ncbi:hypothetical protein AURDEDRAFT_172650 [Auricularia subglabra TFB-10046 SS5]|nr:hypothetical protein AURDEDRAFT_172650 [Auricularia subglabra TFB-10046 SS5]
MGANVLCMLSRMRQIVYHPEPRTSRRYASGEPEAAVGGEERMHWIGKSVKIATAAIGTGDRPE